MNLFNGKIENWKDWGEVYASISAFTPLVDHILQKEKLPRAAAENLTPGTNAVFRTGGYVVKIYAPDESGIDQTPTMNTELFAARRAARLGISAPKLVADGYVDDKYRFAYIVTEFIEGVEFAEAAASMGDSEKIAIGRRLRRITDRMNTPCEPFNDIDALAGGGRFRRWDKYPDSFKAERLSYIRTRAFEPPVFVHGDLCGDNILVARGGELCILDFGDALLAPVVYEHAHVALELFRLDPALLYGFFGDFNDTNDNINAINSCYSYNDINAKNFIDFIDFMKNNLVDICFDGMLIHDFGGDIVKAYVGEPSDIVSLDILRRKLQQRIDNALYGIND